MVGRSVSVSLALDLPLPAWLSEVTLCGRFEFEMTDTGIGIEIEKQHSLFKTSSREIARRRHNSAVLVSVLLSQNSWSICMAARSRYRVVVGIMEQLSRLYSTRLLNA